MLAVKRQSVRHLVAFLEDCRHLHRQRRLQCLDDPLHAWVWVLWELFREHEVASEMSWLRGNAHKDKFVCTKSEAYNLTPTSAQMHISLTISSWKELWKQNW